MATNGYYWGQILYNCHNLFVPTAISFPLFKPDDTTHDGIIDESVFYRVT